MSKFYAVKKGKSIGIFNTWAECQEATKGFPNAEFKSFNNKDEAEAYMEDVDIYYDEVKKKVEDGYAVAFTDGSFDEKINRYSYGVVCIDREMNEHELYNYSENPKYLSTRNIIGEILGVFSALDWAITNGYNKIIIYHDYEGLKKWYNKDWKAESDVSKMYVSKLEKQYKDLINIDFIKVKAHSNNKYNEKADQLAKMALKDRKKLINTGINWFTIPAFKREELDSIIELMQEEISELIIYSLVDDLNKYMCKLKLEDNEITITLFKTNNKTLMIQGNMNVVFQIFLTYINELLGIEKIKNVIGNVCKKKIDEKKVVEDYNKICPNLPSDYPDSCKDLIRQAIINLSYYVEAIDYSQYAFPALRALEGHIKYLCNKNGINVVKEFSVFNFDKSTGKHYLATSQPISADTKKRIEDLYEYYYLNRHTLFHIGDMFGAVVSTRTLTQKSEADEIIKKVLSMINEI